MPDTPSRIVAVEHVTLDGVYQAPGRPDEFEAGGFPFGGWASARNDPKMQETIAPFMAGGWSLLAGRVTYEVLYESWPVREPASPMTKALTAARKYVVTRDPATSLPWENSARLVGDAVEQVTRLKQSAGTTLILFGSGRLIKALMAAQLVDTFLLMTHPIVLGQGQVLFEAGFPATDFTLADHAVTDKGVTIMTYRTAPAAAD